jgi:hypothetical protein
MAVIPPDSVHPQASSREDRAVEEEEEERAMTHLVLLLGPGCSFQSRYRWWYFVTLFLDVVELYRRF